MILFIFEIIGTVAFAISGAMIAMEKKLDIFGIVILGMTTAVGGGIIRDLILGATPPAAFVKPVYALTAILTANIAFLKPVRKILLENGKASELLLRVTDSVGLGVFTVNGIQIAFSTVPNATVFLAIFVGVLTGIGGGILRDMFAGTTPFVFKKHFYASASIIGAIICCVLWPVVSHTFAMVTGSACIFILRLLAAHYRWTLPRA